MNVSGMYCCSCLDTSGDHSCKFILRAEDLFMASEMCNWHFCTWLKTLCISCITCRCDIELPWCDGIIGTAGDMPE